MMVGLFALVFMAVAAVSQAMVCLPNYCENKVCKPITACNGKVVQNGGFCGCCDVCKAVLNPGDSCFQMILMGVPSTVVCPDNYQCGPALTCVPDA